MKCSKCGMPYKIGHICMDVGLEEEFHLDYIWDRAKELYVRKNTGYGNSIYSGFDLNGPHTTVGRIREKATRMFHIVGPNGDNSTEDLLEELNDIFLMSAMLIFKLEEDNIWRRSR